MKGSRVQRPGSRVKRIGSRFGRVGVLAGGPSNERDISMRSGKAVHNALLGEGVDAIFLDVKNNIREIIENSCMDIAFIALHGRLGEDGVIQKMLEDAGIPYTGSGVEASRLAMDKIASKKKFISKNIPVPRYVIFEKGDFDIKKADDIGYPLVVKPQSEGSSIGLSIANEKKSLDTAISKAFQYGEKIIIEEYIAGRELTVGILDDNALPVVEIVPKNHVYDYAAKYNDPDTQYLVPADIEEQAYENARKLGKAAHNALGCSSFSRVDMIMDSSGKIFVLEVNTIPGMTERSLLPKAAQAAGLRFGELCVKILTNALSLRQLCGKSGRI